MSNMSTIQKRVVKTPCHICRSDKGKKCRCMHLCPHLSHEKDKDGNPKPRYRCKQCNDVCSSSGRFWDDEKKCFVVGESDHIVHRQLPKNEVAEMSPREVARIEALFDQNPELAMSPREVASLEALFDQNPELAMSPREVARIEALFDQHISDNE